VVTPAATRTGVARFGTIGQSVVLAGVAIEAAGPGEAQRLSSH